ncbi:hypothetical protein CspHIS471_0200560 [Cutaneotrichosporon sp. HIS471]|nr:hypothetical protein CspHIS471_0200560 [Cutaneotrichosporon sp. HIS471]
MPRQQLPSEVLSHIASYADVDTCLAILHTGWVGYAAAVARVYADATLSEGLMAGLVSELGDDSVQTMPPGADTWPNTASNERKLAALACVRSLRVRDYTKALYDKTNLITRVRNLLLFLSNSYAIKPFQIQQLIDNLSPTSICIQMSPWDWYCLQGLAAPSASVVTLHDFRLDNETENLSISSTAVRLWPRRSLHEWSEIPWEDNVDDWVSFLGAVEGNVELVLPQEPLTCSHLDEYANAEFYLRVLLRMELDADIAKWENIAMPFGVECPCGKIKEDRWCSAPLLAALKDKGEDELIQRMQARDARLTSPTYVTCNQHLWDVSDMAAAAKNHKATAYAEARAKVVHAMVADARALLREA